MGKKYVVALSSGERQRLERSVGSGAGAAYRIRHAHIVLKADVRGPGWTDERIAEAFGCHVRTVENVRRRCVVDGLDAALERKKQEHPSRSRKLDGAGEARLVAVACSTPREGRDRWTLQLLADELVRLNVVDSIGVQTVRRTLKKTNCSLTGGNVG
jgi:transposase